MRSARPLPRPLGREQVFPDFPFGHGSVGKPGQQLIQRFRGCIEGGGRNDHLQDEEGLGPFDQDQPRAGGLAARGRFFRRRTAGCDPRRAPYGPDPLDPHSTRASRLVRRTLSAVTVASSLRTPVIRTTGRTPDDLAKLKIGNGAARLVGLGDSRSMISAPRRGAISATVTLGDIMVRGQTPRRNGSCQHQPQKGKHDLSHSFLPDSYRGASLPLPRSQDGRFVATSADHPASNLRLDWKSTRMTAKFDNPWRPTASEFVEFTGPQPEALARLFECLGFVEVGRHRHKAVSHFRQGDINLFSPRNRAGLAEEYAARHGPSQRHGFPRTGRRQRLCRGDPARSDADRSAGRTDGLKIPAIAGVGGLVIPGGSLWRATIYDVDFRADRFADPEAETRLTVIDHPLTIWSAAISRSLGCVPMKRCRIPEIRHFAIAGRQTGLLSRAMISACGKHPHSSERKPRRALATRSSCPLPGRRYPAHRPGDRRHPALEDALRRRGIRPFRRRRRATMTRSRSDCGPRRGYRLPAREAGILIDGGAANGGGNPAADLHRRHDRPDLFEIIQRKGNEGFGAEAISRRSSKPSSVIRYAAASQEASVERPLQRVPVSGDCSCPAQFPCPSGEAVRKASPECFN